MTCGPPELRGPVGGGPVWTLADLLQMSPPRLSQLTVTLALTTGGQFLGHRSLACRATEDMFIVRYRSYLLARGPILS